jgi:hypothetical protein
MISSKFGEKAMNNIMNLSKVKLKRELLGH